MHFRYISGDILFFSLKKAGKVGVCSRKKKLGQLCHIAQSSPTEWHLSSPHFASPIFFVNVHFPFLCLVDFYLPIFYLSVRESICSLPFFSGASDILAA